MRCCKKSSRSLSHLLMSSCFVVDVDTVCLFKTRFEQHGFVKGRSCLTNLLEVFEHWTSCLGDGYGVDVVYLDYRKAVDTVPHQRLLTKLKGLGLGVGLMKWIGSFLSDRLMRVMVNGHYSSWSVVVSGCLLYTSPSPRDRQKSRMPSSA